MRKNNTKSTLKKSEDMMSWYLGQTPQFRIEAVIHDGQWYSKEKWAKVAKVSTKELDNFIKNTDYLIAKNGSYRVTTEEIYNWYESHNLDLETPVVPNNFTPKIWGGISETEHLENTPKRLITSLSVSVKNDEVLEKIKKICWGFGPFARHQQKNKYILFTGNSMYVKSLIERELTNEELKHCTLRTRIGFEKRELSDFSDDFIKGFFDFYVAFSLGALKSSKKTLDIFLPDRDDQISQIYDWLTSALGKFDEKSCIPFSGYLSIVLQRWPYDLPIIFVGKDLAKFQRERSSILEELKQVYEDNDVPEEEISEKMNMSFDRYSDLLRQHESWLAYMNRTTLQWEDSGSEKVGRLVGSGPTISENIDSQHKFSLDILRAGINANDSESALKVIREFGKDNIAKLELSKEFKKCLKEEITKK